MFPATLRGTPQETETVVIWKADSVAACRQMYCLQELLNSDRSTGLTKV